MKTKFIAPAVASIALAATPIAAQATTADRASAPVSSASNLEGGSGILIALLAAAAVIAGIIIIADGDDDDEPTSA
ncbi:hypothetical protein [Altererythrobacter sp. ZODW24]|uniref:hypothetical protein n=1 Tax=Altererythrobacter sp. ZODW24 TaxID=2185142 RepID=UPI000DF86253|nr:hypothetical protein [Altererythrobacter sp. ZODW24]